jgi:hypothetical protein
MQLNRIIEHDERPGTRGYTSAGDDAGNHSVLASAGSWRTGSPFLNAPLHLMQVLQPHLVATGANEEFGHSCMQTLASGTFDWLTTPTATESSLYSYPGPGTTQPFYQLVFEAPYAPQSIPPNPLSPFQPTGPNIIMFYEGPYQDGGVSLTRATLVGPSGPVAFKLLGREQQFLLSDYAGMIIPKRPLEPNATYTWTATSPGSDSDGNDVSWTSPPRTFRTTARRLCGAGGSGWYREADCPAFGVRIRRVTGSTSATRARAIAGLRFAVSLTASKPVVGTARIGGVALGRGTARRSGTVVVKLDAAKLDARLAASPTRRVVVAVTFQSGLALLTRRVVVSG